MVVATVLPVIAVDESTTVTHWRDNARVEDEYGTLFIAGGRDCEIRLKLEPWYAKEFKREDMVGPYAEEDARRTRELHDLFVRLPGTKVTRIDGMDLDTRMKIDGTVSGRIQCEHPNFSEVPRDDQGRS